MINATCFHLLELRCRRFVCFTRFVRPALDISFHVITSRVDLCITYMKRWYETIRASLRRSSHRCLVNVATQVRLIQQRSGVFKFYVLSHRSSHRIHVLFVSTDRVEVVHIHSQKETHVWWWKSKHSQLSHVLQIILQQDRQQLALP